MKNNKILQDLISFLDSSPTAWHAVANIKTKLLEKGFQELDEGEPWKLEKEGRYFVDRNGSSLCAFVVPAKRPVNATILGSHTDSPALKLKPNAEYQREHMTMLATEIYGGPLLNSWLNRDLGIAGRICCLNRKGEIVEKLVCIRESPVIIPQLAIHLDRTVNETGLLLNKQEHLSALACVSNSHQKGHSYLEHLLQKEIGSQRLISHDLFLFPLEPARFIGIDQQMIASYRLDNLSSVHAAQEAMTNIKTSSPKHLTLALFWDNEEVGSDSAQGAGSPFLPHILERILLALGVDREGYFGMLSRALCISIDLGHAMHPNHPEKSDPQHTLLLNKGIIIKTNALQRYASDARSAAAIIQCCHSIGLSFQNFASRGDIPCGSTIGPITAHLTGINTVDIGIPQLSMHSCREIIGSQDHLDLCRLLTAMLERHSEEL